MNTIVSSGVVRKMEAKCRLKIIMIEEGITQKELAGKLDVTQQQVSNWANGYTVPKMDTLLRLSKILNRSINDFYELEE